MLDRLWIGPLFKLFQYSSSDLGELLLSEFLDPLPEVRGLHVLLDLSLRNPSFRCCLSGSSPSGQNQSCQLLMSDHRRVWSSLSLQSRLSFLERLPLRVQDLQPLLDHRASSFIPRCLISTCWEKCPLSPLLLWRIDDFNVAAHLMYSAAMLIAFPIVTLTL